MQDGGSLHFLFDKVHGLPNGASNTQANTFSDIQDIVQSTLEGLNGSVLAYGQTGVSSRFSLIHTLPDMGVACHSQMLLPAAQYMKPCLYFE